jgi:hypothetical protein
MFKNTTSEEIKELDVKISKLKSKLAESSEHKD